MAKIDNFRVVPGMTRTSTIDGKRVRKLAFTHKVTGELVFFSEEEIKELRGKRQPEMKKDNLFSEG